MLTRVSVFLSAWVTPSLTDWLIMSGLGFVWAGGMYLNALAIALYLAFGGSTI
jgi:hypothetical protein